MSRWYVMSKQVTQRAALTAGLCHFQPLRPGGRIQTVR